MYILSETEKKRSQQAQERIRKAANDFRTGRASEQEVWDRLGHRSLTKDALFIGLYRLITEKK